MIAETQRMPWWQRLQPATFVFSEYQTNRKRLLHLPWKLVESKKSKTSAFSAQLRCLWGQPASEPILSTSVGAPLPQRLEEAMGTQWVGLLWFGAFFILMWLLIYSIPIPSKNIDKLHENNVLQCRRKTYGQKQAQGGTDEEEA